MRELRLEIREADPSYVDEKVGAELYVHLRAAPANVTLRRRALQRAHRLYISEAGADDEGSRGALGLLVLQRAMLAVEDLGGLLHALADPARFSRLVSYDLGDLITVFDLVVRDSHAVSRLYRLPGPEAIAAEPGLEDDQAAAMQRLRLVTLAHLRRQLGTIQHFWDSLHFEAKKTMHGVGFIAGYHALARPGAGMVSAFVDPTHPRPFALALDTHVDYSARHANTTVGTVDLSPRAVERMRNAGEAACDATDLLVAGRLHGLQTNHAYTLPATYINELVPGDRDALAPLFNG